MCDHLITARKHHNNSMSFNLQPHLSISHGASARVREVLLSTLALSIIWTARFAAINLILNTSFCGVDNIVGPCKACAMNAPKHNSMPKCGHPPRRKAEILLSLQVDVIKRPTIDDTTVLTLITYSACSAKRGSVYEGQVS